MPDIIRDRTAGVTTSVIAEHYFSSAAARATLLYALSISVIDLFSGPGGLGEGFAGLDGGRAFKIVVSAEMDKAAHKTLRLRAYYRLLKASGQDMKAYYDFCRETATRRGTRKRAGNCGKQRKRRP